MKKFYLTLALLSTVALGFAQHAITTTQGNNVTLSPKRFATDRAVGYYYVDYEGYDASLGTLESGALFFNRRNPVYFNPLAPTPLGMNMAAVVFDEMIVTTDGVVYDIMNPADVQSFFVDTAFVRIYHENNSTLADTIILSIKNVSGTGTPGTSTMWADTIITTTSLTTPNTGNTYGFATFGFPVGTPGVGFNVGAGGDFSLYVEYYGASVDTFGLISSNITTGNACTTPGAGNEMITSEVFPSAFYRYWQSTTISSVNPNGTGTGGLFIDCDNDASPDWLTEQAVQTFSIWVSGTVTDNASIDEEEAGATVKAYPNPAQDFTTIDFTLKQNSTVAINMTDLSGKIVYSNDLGKRDVGNHNIVVNTSELSNGVYMYTLVVNNKKVTRRIIVNR